MAELFKNLASTTLNGDIDDSTTSVVVNSAMGFTGGNFRILVDSEIMKVTGVSGTTLTVVRQQEGTSASAHSNGAAVKHVLTAGALDAHDQNDLAAYDTFANRPAAGTPGRIFLPSDGLFIERDNGATWEKFGPIWPMTPPVASDFPTWVNQGSATITDNKGAIWLYSPYSSTENLRIRVKSYPATPFTVEMVLLPNVWMYTGNIAMGLCLRDSVSQKLVCVGLGGGTSDMQIKGGNWTSHTSYSGGITGWPSNMHHSESPLIFLKYYDDGSANRVWSVSVDGTTWTQLVSISRTDFLTPNQIGIFVNSGCGYNSPYADIGMTVLSWRQY
jgi:hypothetical protein